MPACCGKWQLGKFICHKQGYINLAVNIPGSTAKGLARCHPWWPPRAHQRQHRHDQWTKWRSSLALHVASSSLLCSVSGWSAWSGPTNTYRRIKCITENFQFASTRVKLRTQLSQELQKKNLSLIVTQHLKEIKNIFGMRIMLPKCLQVKLKITPLVYFKDKQSLNDIHTFPDFHLISVDFEDGSPLSFKWNSLESTLFSKYGFSSKY